MAAVSHALAVSRAPRAESRVRTGWRFGGVAGTASTRVRVCVARVSTPLVKTYTRCARVALRTNVGSAAEMMIGAPAARTATYTPTNTHTHRGDAQRLHAAADASGEVSTKHSTITRLRDQHTQPYPQGHRASCVPITLTRKRRSFFLKNPGFSSAATRLVVSGVQLSPDLERVTRKTPVCRL